MTRKNIRAASLSELAQRLKAARAAICLTQDELASSTGVSLRTWQNYEAGRFAPDMKILAELVARGVNSRWLLLGERPVLAPPPIVEGPEGTIVDPGDFVYLPYFPAAVSAGPGRFALEEPEPVALAFRKEWIKRTVGIPAADLMLLPFGAVVVGPRALGQLVILANLRSSKRAVFDWSVPWAAA